MAATTDSFFKFPWVSYTTDNPRIIFNMYHSCVVIQEANPSILVQKMLGEMWKLLISVFNKGEFTD